MIQAPSHPLEYRAVGRIYGQYFGSLEKPSVGFLMTPENQMFDARLIQQAKTALPETDPSKTYLWRCYPKQTNGKLSFHLLTWREAEVHSVSEDVFSTRGLVTSISNGAIAVRVYKNQPKPWLDLYTDLILEGFLPREYLDGFVDLEVCREGNSLVIVDGSLIASAGEFNNPQTPKREKVENQRQKPVSQQDRPKKKYPAKGKPAVVKEALKV